MKHPGPPVPTSAMFDRVPAALRAAIEARGFTELTPVQIAALDAIDASRDLRISSQTGSGKTVALGLAIAPELVGAVDRFGRCGPAALVIVPTRELAAQVRAELEWLYAQLPGVRVECVTGGTHVGQERRRLARKPQILVGTPGRLVDHIGSGALDCRGVRQLVLDEADQMLDMGFREDLDTIVAAIPSEGRRTHLLSATFPDSVRELAEEFQPDALHVEGTQLGLANADIAHVGHVVRSRDTYGAIVNLLLLGGDQRTLVFVATRADASTLAEKLAGDGFSALPLSGELAQAQRTRTLSAFRNGSISVIVATDVAARGIDVPEITTVIHADLPVDGEIYTHRSGRTGRAGRKGRSIVLATPNGTRRARRIFEDAGVSVDWPPVPSAADVRSALEERNRARIGAVVERTEETSALAFAERLLADRDPARVVAALISELGSGATREPIDIEPQRQRIPARDQDTTRAGRSRSGPRAGRGRCGRDGKPRVRRRGRRNT